MPIVVYMYCQQSAGTQQILQVAQYGAALFVMLYHAQSTEHADNIVKFDAGGVERQCTHVSLHKRGGASGTQQFQPGQTKHVWRDIYAGYGKSPAGKMGKMPARATAHIQQRAGCGQMLVQPSGVTDKQGAVAKEPVIVPRNLWRLHILSD